MIAQPNNSQERQDPSMIHSSPPIILTINYLEMGHQSIATESISPKTITPSSATHRLWNNHPRLKKNLSIQPANSIGLSIIVIFRTKLCSF